MHYFLELGRLRDLSMLELQHLFSGMTLQESFHNFVMIECSEEEIVSRLNRSGGVIKAMELIETIESTDAEKIMVHLIHFLQKFPKPIFHIHEINRPNQQKAFSHQEVKNRLKDLGTPSRFIEAESKGLSASVLLHQNVDEVHVVYQENKTILLRTMWVQNIDDWSVRDYEKPRRDPKRGMLPPKLARMMINFTSPELQAQPKKLLYDPFCGTGTVLMEGLLTGWDVMGSDLSPEAVRDSAENLHWFNKRYNQAEPTALFIQDATTVTLQQIKTKVDAIVTEPFLGKQNPSSAQLQNMFKGLEKQYWGALRNWTHILKDGGEVVIVTPLVEDKIRYSLEKIIDKSRELGYNVISGPVVYNREQTTIQRAIYVLKLHKSKIKN